MAGAAELSQTGLIFAGALGGISSALLGGVTQATATDVAKRPTESALPISPTMIGVAAVALIGAVLLLRR